MVSLKSKVIKSSSVLLASFMLLGVDVSASTLTGNLIKCNKNNPYHILVNEQHQLSKDYVPSNLVIPNVKFSSSGNIEKNHMEATAGKALENMFNGAKKEGITLVAVSGYRGYERQSALYNNAVRQYGVSQKGSAKPNASEHRTGLAMDINSVDQSFADTKEGKWLASNAHKYGYIIRYPKGKTSITGYIYEPWHVRYVGVELATYCHQNNKTLEELDFCCAYEEFNQTIKIPHIGTTLIDVPMLVDNGVSYIKVRDLTNAFGLGLDLTNSGVKITDKKGGKYQVLTVVIPDSKIYGNGERLDMTFKSFNQDGSIYVPIRDTLTLLGYGLTATPDLTWSVVKHM